MLYATVKAGHKEIIRVEWKPVAKWTAFMVFLAAFRISMFKFFPSVFNFKEAFQNIGWLPWQATLTVFWEDAAHGLPLLLLRQFLGTKWPMIPIHVIAMALVMLSFGLGHTYQGNTAAMMLSLYIPYSVSLGKKIGFGTVMINHSIFDLSTILSIQYMMGMT